MPKKLKQACSISRDLVYVPKKIEQACSISRDLVYVSLYEIVQVCTILKFLIKV